MDSGRTSWLTFSLVVVFGMGSWVAINGLWSELFVLIPYTHEQYKLTAYLTIIIQIANIGPIVYTISEKFAGEERRINCQSIGVAAIVVIGTLACILLSQLWHKCSVIAGTERSTALIVLAFFLALVDCTSSVVFLPFLAAFPAKYLSALYVGEGFSGLIPSALALGQFHNQVGTCGQNSSYTVAVGCNSTGEVHGVHFQPNVYFGCLAAITISCGMAFVFLRRRAGSYTPITDTSLDGTGDTSCASDSEPHKDNEYMELREREVNVDDVGSDCLRDKEGDLSIPMLMGLAWMCALANGVLPAVSSYAYFPYGQLAFLLTTVAGILSAPAASFVFLALPSKSKPLVILLISVATLIAAYILFLASYCHRPLECQDSGTAVVVILVVVFSSCVSYSKVAISTIAHHSAKARGLRWCGIVTQIGSFLGAIVTFSLTEKGVFAEPHCS